MKLVLILIPALAAGLTLGTLMHPPAIISPSPGAPSVVTNVVTNTVRTIVNVLLTNEQTAVGEPFHWRHIITSDPHQYVANLRTVGCPEQTVKDIILALVNKQFAPQFAAVKPQPQGYWQKRRQHFANVDQTKQLMALEKQRRQLLKDLLGYEVKDPDHRGYKPEERDEFSFLSPDRHAALSGALQALRDQQEQRMQMIRAELVTTKASTQFSEQQLANKWRELEAETRQQLTQWLTKEELEQYDLRTSDVAHHLRSALSGFDPTPDEFREMFRRQRQLDEQFNIDRSAGQTVDEGRSAEWKAAKETMEGQLRQSLGEQRFADYQRSQDPEYRMLLLAVDRYDLNPEVPMKTWSLRETAETERRRILAQERLSASQRRAQLGQLAATTQQELTTLMGESGFQKFERLSGPKSWLAQLREVPQD